MNYYDSYTYQQQLGNQLPPQFHSWLEFYDDLMQGVEEMREEAVLQVEVELSRDNYQWHFMQELPGSYRSAIITYHITRDFMLARVAELLLPARYSMAELETYQQAFYATPSGLSFEDRGNFIKRLLPVALR